MNVGNFSKHGMTFEQIRELQELKHYHRLKEIEAETDAHINRRGFDRDATISEIEAKADAEIGVCTHQAKLMKDVFEKKASLEMDVEAHRTRQIGERLAGQRRFESFQTAEHSKRVSQQMALESHKTQQSKLLEQNKTQEQNKRFNRQIEAQAHEHQLENKRLDKVRETARGMMADCLNFQYCNKLLEEGASSSTVTIEELPDEKHSPSPTP